MPKTNWLSLSKKTTDHKPRREKAISNVLGRVPEVGGLRKSE